MYDIYLIANIMIYLNTCMYICMYVYIHISHHITHPLILISSTYAVPKPQKKMSRPTMLGKTNIWNCTLYMCQLKDIYVLAKSHKLRNNVITWLQKPSQAKQRPIQCENIELEQYLHGSCDDEESRRCCGNTITVIRGDLTYIELAGTINQKTQHRPHK